MELPPTFLDELRSRVSLVQVVGRKVAWDLRRSNQAKGDWWAPCPFHQEKTASFHVDDRKGFYYCFGCHAKGDALTFLRESENLSFMEAVETLAREVGMEMPARDPGEALRSSQRRGLRDVVEEAVRFCQLQLKTGAGHAARGYLDGRGLNEAVRERWQIGLAPPARDALLGHLTGKGIAVADVVAAGLAIVPDGGGAPYDRFRNRIIIPIRDARGRVISLGGRALDPGEKAKYLNGPETEIFDKGRVLFNLDRARALAGKAGPVVVVEGYMDAIALHEAGFAAVAPLGTAVTEEQLRLLWRVDDEPVVALDGDQAGMRAALRLVDLALPLVEAGKGLRFVLLPDGMDPDDLIRAKGAGAMRAQVEAAVPMVQLLWQRETVGRVFDSPERWAALDRQIETLQGRIRDPVVRSAYRDALRNLRFGLQQERRQGARRGGRRQAAAVAIPAPVPEEDLREAVILAVLISNPGIIPEFVHDLETMDWQGAGHAPISGGILGHGAQDGLRAALVAQAGAAALERLFAIRHVMLCPAVARPGNADLARQTVSEELVRLRARRGHRLVIEEAMADIAGVADEWLTRRLSEAAAAVDVTRPKEQDDLREVDVASNGLAVDREERESLDRLVEGIEFRRKGGR
ncbi:MAG: DNA primase [Rubellimicrobium sp.]|nr:DNA primase [Rubellimicrobium sp.]